MERVIPAFAAVGDQHRHLQEDCVADAVLVVVGRFIDECEGEFFSSRMTEILRTKGLV